MISSQNSNSSLSARPIFIGTVVILVANAVIAIVLTPIMMSFLTEVTFELPLKSDSAFEILPWSVIVVVVAMSSLGYLIGGYVTARLASQRVVAHAIAAGLIPLTLGAVSEFVERDSDKLLLAIATVVGIAGVVLGGLLVQRSRGASKLD